MDMEFLSRDLESSVTLNFISLKYAVSMLSGTCFLVGWMR